jgi:hypothetical protein
MKRLLLVLSLSLAVTWAVAQDMELGILGGVSLYSGDLAPEEFGVYFEELGPAIGAFGRLNFNKSLAARFGITYGQITANDANGTMPERGLEIQTSILEFALTAEWNLFTLGNRRGTQFKPYLFAGGGLYLFSPEGRFDNEWIELQPLGTEAQGAPGYEEPYTLTQFNVPVGLGMRFIFNESWSLGVEFGGRKLFTDHLDDVSGAEVNYLDVLTNNGDLAAMLSNPLIKSPEEGDVFYRRGGEFDDWYYFGTVTLSFYLGRGNGGGRNGRGPACYEF